MGPEEMEAGPPGPPPHEAAVEPSAAQGEQRRAPAPPPARRGRDPAAAAPPPRAGSRTARRPSGGPPERCARRRPASPPRDPSPSPSSAWLWLLSVPLFLGGGDRLTPCAPAGRASSPPSRPRSAIVLGRLGGVMGFGLLTLRPWARILQIGLAGLGLLVCPFALASAAVLVYMLPRGRPRYFSGLPRSRDTRSPPARTELDLAASRCSRMVAARRPSSPPSSGGWPQPRRRLLAQSPRCR